MSIPPPPRRSKILIIIWICCFLILGVLRVCNNIEMKKEQERRQQVFLSLPQPQYSLEDNKKQIIQSLNLGTDAITDGTTDVEALVRKIKALKDGSSLGGKKE